MSEIGVDVHHAVLDSAEGVFDARVNRLFCLSTKKPIFMGYGAFLSVQGIGKEKGRHLSFYTIVCIIKTILSHLPRGP